MDILTSLVLLLFAAIFPGSLLFFSVRAILRRRKGTEEPLEAPILYGAWQGHELGTSTYDPDSSMLKQPETSGGVEIGDQWDTGEEPEVVADTRKPE